LVEVNYKPGLYDSVGATLSLEYSNGERLEFNSLEDSDANWNQTYAEVIYKIYKSI
jgi:hypothetical protein